MKRYTEKHNKNKPCNKMTQRTVQATTYPLLLAIAIFSFYLFCLPQVPTLEDDGLFILSLYYNGVSHPPGYPLHSLLGHLFLQLPLGTPAEKAHALSALFTALSSILIYLITCKITAHFSLQKLTAYIAAIAFPLSNAVWSQSIITEVYTLNVLLFLAVLYCTLNINAAIEHSLPGRQQQLKLNFFYIGLLSGLALANHWPLFILASAGIIFIHLQHFKVVVKYWHYILFGVASGLTLYLWLYINSNSDTFIKFYGSLENWHELWAYISRQHFNQIVDFSPTATLSDKANFFLFTLKQLISQWGLLNSLFVPLGIAAIFKLPRNQQKDTLAILISYLSCSILLVFILGYDFNPQNRTDITPFLVAAHSLGAIFFAIGVSRLLVKVQCLSDKNYTAILLFLVLGQALAANTFVNYRANYNWSTIYAKQVLDSLKPDSTLFVSGDISTGVIGYWHFIMQYRPDITVIHDEGLVFGTRLFDPRKQNKAKKKKIILDYMRAAENPVYFIENKYNFGVKNHWLIYEYDKNLRDGEEILVPLNPDKDQYLRYIFSDKTFKDNWTQTHKVYLQIRALGHLLVKLSSEQDIIARQQIINDISKASHSLQGLTVTLILASKLQNIHLFSTTEQLINRGWQLYAQTENKEHKAGFLNLLAYLAAQAGDEKQSLALYRQSAEVWPHNKNPAMQKIFTDK